MLHSKKLCYSVNPEIVDRKAPLNNSYLSSGFKPIEDTIEQLAAVICEEGWAFSYQFANNYRNKQNFIKTDIACVDVDGGLSIEDALNNEFVKNYCSMMYTTCRHTPEHHRFRLVFILPRTIMKAEEIVSISRSLGRRLGGDMVATDSARMFYGNKGCVPLIFDKCISDKVLDELIQDGAVVYASDSILNVSSTTNRSMYKLDPEMEVVTKSGYKIKIKDVQYSTSIHCPFHNDENPSAYISKNKRNQKFIHCKACNMTWWMRQEGDAEDYDFYSFDESIDAILQNDNNILQEINSQFGDFIEPIRISPKNIYVTNNKFLSLSKLQDGVTFIKSQKGSGKTTYLAEVLGDVIFPFKSLEDYESVTDYETELSFIGKEKILLIGHRQALIGDLCKRLKLNCYLDDHKNKKHEIDERQKRYGVCLDSLWKVKNKKYDIIIIDEVEQVLAHFLSETIGEKRVGIFNLLSSLVQNASKVVVLDADLGWASFITLTSLTHPLISQNLNNNNNCVNKMCPVHVYINKNTAQNDNLQVYASQYHLIQEVMMKIVDNKRIFITSNSKSKIKTLYESINKFIADNGLIKSVISVTSENSRRARIQEFINNIKTEILNYDVVLSSPSMGTGIDITFENSAQEIDCVFGIFENRINSHFEIDQQLARVRHPKEVKVWISPTCYNFETEFGVIAKDILHDKLMDISMNGMFNSSKAIMEDLSPFYIMASMITSQQRASKNYLKRNFIDYKKRNGHGIVVVKADENLARQGADIFNEGKYIKEVKYFHNIISSNIMNQFEYFIFEEKVDSTSEEIVEEEWISYIKTKLEMFYFEPVTESLLVLDNKGLFRSNILRYEKFIIYIEQLKNNSVQLNHDFGNIHNKIFKNREISNTLLYEILSRTPLMVNYQFDLNAVIVMEDLVDFCDYIEKNKHNIFTHLNIILRKDFRNKPVRTLSQIFGTIGLGTIKHGKPRVINGKKIYQYKIDYNLYNTMISVIMKRESYKYKGWDYINKTYNFNYTELQEIRMNPDLY